MATTNGFIPESRNLAGLLSVSISLSRMGTPACTARRSRPSFVPIATRPEKVCTGAAMSSSFSGGVSRMTTSAP